VTVPFLSLQPPLKREPEYLLPQLILLPFPLGENMEERAEPPPFPRQPLAALLGSYCAVTSEIPIPLLPFYFHSLFQTTFLIPSRDPGEYNPLPFFLHSFVRFHFLGIPPFFLGPVYEVTAWVSERPPFLFLKRLR